MELLGQLNPSQREAVTATEGPVLVLAGPGSGKTRVLTHRVAYLVEQQGVRPDHIVAVTFTNKAAREMKERLLQLLGPRYETLTIGTFHAICARILRREGGLLGFSPSYTIYDSDDQIAVVKRVLKELNVDEKSLSPGSIHNLISKAKNNLVAPENYRANEWREEIVRRAYVRYQQVLRESNAMDFDDLLMYVAQIFQNHPDVLARYQRRYQYVLVDEFQDTNAAQYLLLRLLVAEHRNLFVVADEDQSVYSWRGADYRNIQRFREGFPEAKVILLERNYRSTQAILDAANSVISQNIHRTPKRLYTDRGQGILLHTYEAYDEQEEGQFVVDEIQRLVRDKEARFGDVAVMYRTNAQSRAIEEAFVRAGMAYKLVGATRFYERREVKDVLAYLRILYNPADGVSLNRIINVPPRGLGDKTVTSLFAWAAELGLSAWDALHVLRTLTQDGGEHPFGTRAASALLDFLGLWEDLFEASKTVDVGTLMQQALDKTGYAAQVQDGTPEGDDRWANVMELVGVAGQYSGMEDSLTLFLEDVALVSDVDDLGEQPDVPVLLTLHMAKGLEFPVVFIVGLEEGILPHTRSSDSAEELEEERRLLYVGITRAKNRVYLVRAFRRAVFGRSEPARPSRFLSDIPLSLVQGLPRESAYAKAVPLGSDRWRWPSSAERPGVSRGQAARRSVKEPEFHTGDRVKHPKFGEGTVVDSKTVDGDELVTVEFAGQVKKKLLQTFANLEKVR